VPCYRPAVVRDGRVSAGGTPRGTSDVARIGVVLDADSVLRLGTLRREFGRLQNLRRRSAGDRRTLMGMAHLVRALIADRPDTPVYYLTGLPMGFARPVRAMLAQDGYPSGTALMASGWLRPWALLARRWVFKRSVLDRLVELRPELRWVLIGDDWGEDASLFLDLAERAPDRVAVIGFRRVVFPYRDHRAAVGGVPVVAAPNAAELVPLLRACVGLEQPRGSSLRHWLLTGSERGNDASALRLWTPGNDAQALVHGSAYFVAVRDALAASAAGDSVLFSGWRADLDERLDGDGATVGGALCGAARRGSAVRGLLWRSYPAALGYFRGVNRALARELAAAGGRVLLDQGTRPFGCHHQKFLAVRYHGRAADDVAYLGGIDLAAGRRDDDVHRGDPQPTASSHHYGRTPPWHDVHLALRGPAVRDVEEVFRERWRSRAGPPSPPSAEPPAAGSCTVQILRTYPARPRRSFAPKGERSIARAYAKALNRAHRLVYVEDQYMWSFDVAIVFAAALHRAPRLQVVAVIPRYPDVERRLYRDAARLGHGEALAMVQEAGGDRVQILDLENEEGTPIYVHAKLCIIDDVWAVVGSANLNMRSWTHDSELAAAVLDDERDPRQPVDPGGLGDGARCFARELRLRLMREHLATTDDALLLDPDTAAETVRRSAATLEAWHAGGRAGPRPPGRLRPQRTTGHGARTPARLRWLTAPAYRTLLDPDGRSLGMRLRRTY
jgi:phosphatidylserine/phosphatidylglycerophosphate/cardiolipin synthase-like enzyme